METRKCDHEKAGQARETKQRTLTVKRLLEGIQEVKKGYRRDCDLISFIKKFEEVK